MLLGPAKDGTNMEALTLGFIEERYKAWGYPYAGSKLKPSTYLYGTLSIASFSNYTAEEIYTERYFSSNGVTVTLRRTKCLLKDLIVRNSNDYNMEEDNLKMVARHKTNKITYNGYDIQCDSIPSGTTILCDVLDISKIEFVSTFGGENCPELDFVLSRLTYDK